MEAWAKYAIQLTNQLGKRGVHTAQPIGDKSFFGLKQTEGQINVLGENMPSIALENFTDEQIAQVGYTLHHISMAV